LNNYFPVYFLTPCCGIFADFLREHPEIVERVPLRHIASYLGITPEALSRIRRELAEKQQ
jgi:CRP-like cAMP-binding protein